MSTHPNQSAFPIGETTHGLTKRELFAAMAMQGILASPFDCGFDKVNEIAVVQADGLIAALNKPREGGAE